MLNKNLFKLLLDEFPKLVVILGVLLLTGAGVGSIPKLQLAMDNEGRIFLGLVGSILFVVGLTLVLRASRMPPSIDGNPILQVFSNTQDPKFQERFMSLASEASEVILIGTGLAILEQNVITNLINLTNSGKLKKLELYLGNPYSHQVELRLWEEECGNHTPLIPKDVLKQKIESILLEIDKNAQHKECISLRLFSNYPTFALFKIDEKYFIYNYSYAELGTYSPVLEFNNSNQTLAKFFNDHYIRLKESSVNAQAVFRIASNAFTNRDLNDLAAFAVYFIPEAQCAEYQLGSKILGYDVREKSPLTSPWQEWVGSAAEFGLHLTIADALYFFSKQDVNFLETQIRDFCARLKPFSLRYEVVAGFPDATTISLVCTDSSGSLHAIHSDMVARCYSQAAGSNYTLHAVPTNRNYCMQTERTAMMKKLYKAPYVLECFKPHITLLTKVPAEKIMELTAELAGNFHDVNPQQTISVKKIAIMEKSHDSWALKGEELPLGHYIAGV